MIRVIIRATFLPLLGLAAMLSLGGCSRTGQGAAIGAGVGAVTGGVIGHQTGHKYEGAAIGAGVGAVTGGAIGYGMDQNERGY